MSLISSNKRQVRFLRICIKTFTVLLFFLLQANFTNMAFGQETAPTNFQLADSAVQSTQPELDFSSTNQNSSQEDSLHQDQSEDVQSNRSNSSNFPNGQAELNLDATLTESGENIVSGMQWKIYSARPSSDNELPLIAESSAGHARFLLPPDDYVIFAAFGRAEKTKEINLKANHSYGEKFNLNAGGLKLTAIIPNGKINLKQLRFAIYNKQQSNDPTPYVNNIKPNEIVRLPAGSYHIVSTYGKANAVARSDINVEAGRLIDVTMQQRAAQIIIKLVRQKGGEALADTSWAIMNYSGDIVREIPSANAFILLSEGDYVAVARNKDQVYQKDFSVTTGQNQEIEVIAEPQNSIDQESVD